MQALTTTKNGLPYFKYYQHHEQGTTQLGMDTPYERAFNKATIRFTGCSMSRVLSRDGHQAQLS